jgi:hypothetical protein
MRNEINKKIIPMLEAYKNYFLSIIDLLLRREMSDCAVQRKIAEIAFQALPNWYYPTRVKIPFEVGRRFFLVKIDQLGEILFSMHHLAHYSFDSFLLEQISEPLLIFSNKVKQFIDAIITVLNLKDLSEQVGDMAQSIARLEQQFRTVVPYTTELLDVSKDAVYFAEFIFELKELRFILLKLAEALRSI